jgi:hypothetical protein
MTLITYDHKLRRAYGTLYILVQIHKDHITHYNCETWQDYINDIKKTKEQTHKLHNLELYLEYCNDVDNEILNESGGLKKLDK